MKFTQYLERVHDENSGLTFRCFSKFYTETGLTSYEELVELIRESADGKSQILDVACGEGFFLAALEKASVPFLAYHGIDISKNEIEEATRNHSKSKAVFTHGNVFALPVGDESFTHVSMHMALMLFEPIERAINEIHRVLKKGGILSFVVGGMDSSNNGYTQLSKIVRSKLPKGRLSTLDGKPQEALSSETDVTRLFDANDWELLSSRTMELLVGNDVDEIFEFYRASYFWEWLGVNELNNIKKHIKWLVSQSKEPNFPLLLCSLKKK